jgi:hypothetical protein
MYRNGFQLTIPIFWYCQLDFEVICYKDHVLQKNLNFLFRSYTINAGEQVCEEVGVLPTSQKYTLRQREEAIYIDLLNHVSGMQPIFVLNFVNSFA